MVRLKERPEGQYTCREGILRLNLYLRALEMNYQAHLVYIQAMAADITTPMDAYAPVMDAARERVRQARCNLLEHQKTHGCAVVHPENFQSDCAA